MCQVYPSELNDGTATAARCVQVGMDDDERQALRAEGLDPDDPAVVGAVDLVRWELSLCAWVLWGDSGGYTSRRAAFWAEALIYVQRTYSRSRSGMRHA